MTVERRIALLLWLSPIMNSRFTGFSMLRSV
jgi:hypothetical protein